MIVEFASNDAFDTGAFKSQERLSFERLLRKLLDFPQRSVRPPGWPPSARQVARSLALHLAVCPTECRPAIVLLNHYTWFEAGGHDDVVADYTRNAENDYDVLGETPCSHCSPEVCDAVHDALQA